MKKLLPVLVVFLVFPAIFKLFFPGFFVSDDGEWMIIRFSSFYEELRHFQIPVRFLHRLNFGFGYPVATFLYPGFMYLAAIFKVLGFGFIASVKAVMVMSILSAFLGMYFFLKNHLSQWSALVGAVFYIYNPYFLYDTYQRGSVGEILAMGIVPFITYFIDSDRRVLASLLTAFLIISHNTLAIIFLPFIVIYFLVNQISKKSSLKILFSRLIVYLVLTMGLSAFFWIPAIIELPLTVFRSLAVSNFNEYFISDISLIGIINCFVLVGSFIYMLINRKYSLVLYLMILIASLSMFLSFGVSAFAWSNDGLGRYVQFPFRFLSLFAFSISYLGAFLFSIIKQYIPIFSILVIGLIMVTGFPFISRVKHITVEDSYYSTNVDTTTVKNEYMPIWAKKLPTEISSQKIERIDENTVQLNSIYWPGYSVTIDGERVGIDYSNERGVMQVITNAPIENISFHFSETKLRLMSDIVTVLSLCIAGVLLFRKTNYV